jgi:hypothetical protein
MQIIPETDQLGVTNVEISTWADFTGIASEVGATKQRRANILFSRSLKNGVRENPVG